MWQHHHYNGIKESRASEFSALQRLTPGNASQKQFFQRLLFVIKLGYEQAKTDPHFRRLLYECENTKHISEQCFAALLGTEHQKNAVYHDCLTCVPSFSNIIRKL
jgi:hypothetical protein